ncbi:MAG: hypothetical protein AAB490_06395 [Patescibacteria group bacterium]
MSKPQNFPEEILDFAHCYLYSGLTLAHQFSQKPPFKTLINLSKGYLLCSHFLTAHGIELYLKFLIKLLGGSPPSNTHNLRDLNIIVDGLLKTAGYSQGLFNKRERALITYLDRYEKFRYPTDKNWNVVNDMFNESKKWTVSKAKKFNEEFKKMIEKLNDWGYKITIKNK